MTSTDPGKATAMVQWLDPVAKDKKGNIYNATCLPSSGTNFPTGISSVVCLTYTGGYTPTCRFEIKVEGNF